MSVREFDNDCVHICLFNLDTQTSGSVPEFLGMVGITPAVCGLKAQGKYNEF